MNDYTKAAHLMLAEAEQATGKQRLATVRQLRSHLSHMQANALDSESVIDELSSQADLLLATFYPTLRRLTPDEQATVCILLADLMRNGPAHFREQAEAKAADIFGGDVAAQMVGRKS